MNTSKIVVDLILLSAIVLMIISILRTTGILNKVSKYLKRNKEESFDNSEYLTSNRIAINRSSYQASNNFMEKLKTGSYGKETLPNSAEDFTGEKELEDFQLYCAFINSRTGAFLKDSLK